MDKKRNVIKNIVFYLGLIIFIIAAFYMMNKSIKYSGGFDIVIKNYKLSIILSLIPITISLILIFYLKKSIFSKILLVISSILYIAMLTVCIMVSYTKFISSQYVMFALFEILGIGLIIISCIDKKILVKIKEIIKNLFMRLKKYVDGKRRIK